MSKKFPEDFPVRVPQRMHNDGIDRYWFYHKESFPIDEPLLYQQLLNSANSSIEIWDPWINTGQNEMRLFSSIKDGITIKLLTLKRLNKPCNANFISDIKSELEYETNHLRNIRFGIRVINESAPAINDKWFFHDRFLIIDSHKVFIIGSSIGWHISSVGSTGIYNIDESETIEFIIALFDSFWDYLNIDTVLKGNELPVQFLHP